MRGTGIHGDVPGSHVHKFASGGRQDAKILLRGYKSSKVPRQGSVHRSGLGIKEPYPIRDKQKGELGQSVQGRDRRWWGGTHFLTLAVSLPHHDVALITLAVVGALRVGAPPTTARLWLLTLVYVCKHMEKA